MFNWMLNT